MMKRVFIGVFGVLWLAGLIVYGQMIATMQPPKVPENVDAIVVLTGGSNRVTTGVALLRDGVGERLFISGVHEKVLFEHLVEDEDLSCCIELGYEAQDTRQNATEVQDWLATHQAETALVITSNYHMPRARLFFEPLETQARLTYYPVASHPADWSDWWAHTRTLRLILSEYHKFLIAYVIM